MQSQFPTQSFHDIPRVSPALNAICLKKKINVYIVTGADPGEVKWVNFHPPFFGAPFFLKVLVFLPFQFQEKEKTKSGYKHNKKVSHGIFNLTFRMLQHTSSEVTVTKYDEI